MKYKYNVALGSSDVTQSHYLSLYSGLLEVMLLKDERDHGTPCYNRNNYRHHLTRHKNKKCSSLLTEKNTSGGHKLVPITGKALPVAGRNSRPSLATLQLPVVAEIPAHHWLLCNYQWPTSIGACQSYEIYQWWVRTSARHRLFLQKNEKW